jgi:hypothetical protein
MPSIIARIDGEERTALETKHRSPPGSISAQFPLLVEFRGHL